MNRLLYTYHDTHAMFNDDMWAPFSLVYHDSLLNSQGTGAVSLACIMSVIDMNSLCWTFHLKIFIFYLQWFSWATSSKLIHHQNTHLTQLHTNQAKEECPWVWFYCLVYIIILHFSCTISFLGKFPICQIYLTITFFFVFCDFLNKESSY